MEQLMKLETETKVAEIELIYKSIVKASERPQINKAADAYDLFLSYWDKNKIDFVEQFKLMLLNRAKRVLGIYELSTGGVAGTVADPKLIFAAALKANASYLIVSHNHPSGNLTPSQADQTLTAKIAEGGKYLDLPVIDHLIITSEGFYSFANEGLL